MSSIGGSRVVNMAIVSNWMQEEWLKEKRREDRKIETISPILLRGCCFLQACNTLVQSRMVMRMYHKAEM
jgi:hypothetical protein